MPGEFKVFRTGCGDRWVVRIYVWEDGAFELAGRFRGSRAYADEVVESAPAFAARWRRWARSGAAGGRGVLPLLVL